MRPCVWGTEWPGARVVDGCSLPGYNTQTFGKESDMSTTTAIDTAQLLKNHFGFDTFREGQQEVIGHLMAGDSAAAVFPTGGGKSLCYQLPALGLSGLTLVVSPLIALMKDQIDALQARGIAAERLDSSLSAAEYSGVVQGVRSGTLRLLYVAPERFANERFREMITQATVSLFAVDEAHCISEWGHNFRPDYLKLARFAQECGAERILALTATAPPNVLEDICREFSISENRAVRTDFYRSNLRLLTSATSADERDELLASRLAQRPKGATIVYVTQQKTAERVAKFLRENGLDARHYHAGLKSDERTASQDWFIHGEQAIMVATIAFGMGIDKSDIRYIYHYNLSKSIENYAQEIGRAGRDGQEAICETLVVPADMRTLENFVFGDTPTSAAVHSLVADVFSRGPELGLSFYGLAAQHDIRELVVRTLITYLELEGYLEGGTPYYAQYRFKPLTSSAEILGRFQGDRREFLATLFRQAKSGRTWFSLDIDTCVAATKSDRQRVVRALDYLAEQGLIELSVAGVHHRFRVVKSPDVPALAQQLYDRTVGRQERELERLQTILRLMQHDGCQVSALGGYFGEPLPQNCGHCSWCENERPIQVQEADAPPIDPQVWAQLERLRDEHRDVLSEPQSVARFASGVSSPALTKAKLSRHPLFGSLADVPFVTILAKL